MGLFDILKGNSKVAELFNPVDGEVIPLEEVADPVFSQKMIGDGFGVKPANGRVYAPSAGEVLSVFPTQHAISLKLDNGIDVLIHIGVDTVELGGVPFEILVEEGTKVTSETQLASVNLEALKNAKKPDTIIVVFTNTNDIEDYKLANVGQIGQGALIGKVVAS